MNTPISVPMFDSASFKETMTLDNNTYQLSFYWNTQCQAWFMDISGADGTPLVSGVKLILNYSLLAQHPEASLPPGIFIILDPSGNDADPGREDFLTTGRNLQLVYVSYE